MDSLNFVIALLVPYMVVIIDNKAYDVDEDILTPLNGFKAVPEKEKLGAWNTRELHTQRSRWNRSRINKEGKTTRGRVGHKAQVNWIY